MVASHCPRVSSFSSPAYNPVQTGTSADNATMKRFARGDPDGLVKARKRQALLAQSDGLEMRVKPLQPLE